MAKKKLNRVATVEFTVPTFRSKGVEYKSADVEAAANDGDTDAQELIKMLIEKGSTVVRMVEVDADELAAQAEAEEKAKAAAAAKAEAQAKAEENAKAAALKKAEKAAEKKGKGKSETKPE